MAMVGGIKTDTTPGMLEGNPSYQDVAG